MKQIRQYQNKFNMNKLLQFLLFVTFPYLCVGQLEDFEDETTGTTSFTVNGVLFNLTGDFVISEFTGFSCNMSSGLNRYVDTGAGDGPSSGVIGTIAPNDMGRTFRLSTTSSQCGWTGRGDGFTNTDGTIRFTGTKLDNTTISEDISLSPSNSAVDLEAFTFSTAIWNGVDLKSLQLEIVGGVDCDYFAMDNIVFEGVVLPVELIKFSAAVIDKSVLLKWQTASEIDNEGFEIEESSDGRKFKKVGAVKGQGTSLIQQDYSFQVSSPVNGVSYYRLKQIDFDGHFEYSKVVSVNLKGENKELGEFYPNPSQSGLVNLDYFAENDEEIMVSVFDMAGKLVFKQTRVKLSGNNNLNFDFSDLNAGIYVLKIGDESNLNYRKLVIER